MEHGDYNWLIARVYRGCLSDSRDVRPSWATKCHALERGALWPVPQRGGMPGWSPALRKPLHGESHPPFHFPRRESLEFIFV